MYIKKIKCIIKMQDKTETFRQLLQASGLYQHHNNNEYILILYKIQRVSRGSTIRLQKN